jgi:PLP dependent protein
MSIVSRIKEISNILPKGTKLLAVSKTKSFEDIMEAYNAGQRWFGENKVQELVQKYESLPKDIKWHMIGHLQTNKVKYIAPFIDMVQSVDSLKLLKAINSEAIKNNRIIKFLLEIFIATEEAKFGLSCDEAEEIIASGELQKLTNVKLVGLMGMASFTDHKDQISKEFSSIKKCFDNFKNKYYSDNQDFCELSIGMSSDFKIATEQGSTIVRLGSTIFGSR